MTDNNKKYLLSAKSEIRIRIRMISEGSCDIEDWSNSCWKFSFAITGKNYILKYSKTENSCF